MTTAEPTKAGVGHLVFLIVLALIAGLMIVGQFAAKKTGKGKIIGRGDRAPEFRLMTVEGAQVDLAQVKGKVVMIHFWATWCPPCVEELPTLAALNSTMAGKDFALLAVSVDEGGAAAVREFLRNRNLLLPVLLDPDHKIASTYGTFKFPETYVLDRSGVVRQKVIGAVDWSDPQAREMVNSLLAAR